MKINNFEKIEEYDKQDGVRVEITSQTSYSKFLKIWVNTIGYFDVVLKLSDTPSIYIGSNSTHRTIFSGQLPPFILGSPELLIGFIVGKIEKWLK